MNQEERDSILNEVQALRQLHGDALCDIEKCRQFGSRMALLLDRLEELGESSLANRAMDILMVCSPKTASHCENSSRTSDMLEHLMERLKSII